MRTATHLLFVSHDANRAGAQLFLLNIMNYFHEQGHNLHLLLLGSGPLEHDFEAISNVIRVKSSLTNGGWFTKLRKETLEKQLQILKKLPIQLVYVNTIACASVVEQLKQTGWQLGGEGSGHILSLQHASTGDGIVASLQVLKAILESGKRLAELKAGMTKLPQVLINVRLSSGSADSILAKDSVKQAVLTAEEVLEDKGRVLLRKSGTEPLIRVMVESTDIALTQQQAEYIAQAVKA